MNCGIILLLVASSAVVGCLSSDHQDDTDTNGAIGFLLYLPGNIEAGSTLQAYIETNTTEPLNVELHFSHGYYKDRNFYSSARIESGSGSIDIEVPEENYWYGSVNLTGESEVSKTKFDGIIHNINIYRNAQQVTFIETDKPLYKPGQEVQFRLITIDSQFKPDTSNISKIQVESPSGIRLAQWRNVERPDGLVDLSFQLISEPPFGEYSIRAYVGDNWVEQRFKVDEYVLPKFEVTISAASFLLINAEEYSFLVCAKYTYGQPVRGYASGKVKKLTKGYYYFDFVSLEDPFGAREVEENGTIAFSGELDDQGCLEATVDVSGMELNSYSTPYWKTYLNVTATVIEASTGNEFTETVSGTKLETTAMNIEMESATTFKPGIPYQGRIKLTYPDDKPASNEVVSVNATVDRKTVHSREYMSDSDGIVYFEVPFAVIDKSIHLMVRSTSYDFGQNSRLYQPRKTFYLDPAFSISGRHIQIVPIYEPVNAGDEVTIQLLYTSDDSLASSDIKFRFVARNKLVDLGAVQGESRRKRTVVVNGGNGETECQEQARESEEKGALGSFKPSCDEDGLFNKSQCRGSTGHCWCVNPETGVELPMTARGPSEAAPDCEAARQEEGPIEVYIGELFGPPDSARQEEGPIEVSIGELGPPDLFNVCPEGFSFANGVKKCVVNVVIEESECERQAREAEGKGLLGSFQPNCHEDGTFLSEQCHGSSGHCWCVDTATGIEIAETNTGPTEVNVECEGTIVESECERQAREAEEKGLLGSFKPNCDEDGTFLSEQCHSSSGHCWCVDTATGLEIAETNTGPTESNIICEELFITAEPPVLVTDQFLVLDPVAYVPPTREPIIHVDPQALQEASFSVTITPGLSPEAKLLVYYTSPEGEVVADSITIKVNEAFENEVRLEFSEPEVTPGSETTLKVSAESGSLCGIGIVDKSVYVLGGENKLTPKKLFSAFDLSVRKVYTYRRCESGHYRFRKKRSFLLPGRYNSVKYKDSADAFSDSGLVTLSNYELQMAPCYNQPRVYYSIMPESRSAPKQLAKDGEAKIRSYFPSTWLWTLQRVGETPVEMKLPVPHTITDWIANGFCTSVNHGVGIAPPVVLRAFQPFFLSMSLPYSIIRTEKTTIKVSVFNYLKQCLVVQVTLAENESFILIGEAMQTIAVPAGEVTTVTYKVAAFVLGEIPLHVTAVSITDDELLCGNEGVTGSAGSTDAVLRKLKVKPEGDPETTTESAYFCIEDGESYKKHISLNVPLQHEPGTAVGGITVTGDLVGNSLSNVEGMLRMPYGCGEQNLVSMVPNIVALQYLESVGEASSEITTKAKKYILSGYQRELNYRRHDNSYSAFGNSNSNGSTFLTAFVIRTYAHAQMFVDIDEEDLSVTIDWLRSIQEKDGSFRTVGYLAHKAMKGGVNNNVTLAAYVLSAFMEAGYTTEDVTVASTFRYLNSQLDSLEDTYSTALLAYAYALADMDDEFDVVYEKLQASAVYSEGTRHWESNREGLPSYSTYYQDSSKAQNIEMTAYVLRAIVIKDIPNLAVEGSFIARWLVAQRNPRGGFSSTQDTVVGLTALAEFAGKVGIGESSDITLTMNIRGGETMEFDVNFENRFVLQQGSFEDFPAEISVSGEGHGCVLYAVSADYYMKKEKQTLDPFSLNIKTKGKKLPARKRRNAEDETEEATCDKFTISISARYNGEDGASNMALINIRPVSGFVFDKESLEALTTNYDFVKRYEVNEDTVTFYFDEITNENIEFEFTMTKEFEVEDAKPAFITILDYYENGLKVAEEFDFVCADEESTSSPPTTYTTPFSPTGFPSSSSTETPDFDECIVSNVCGGPEYECINYPGTYECVCAEGYALDENEENCVAIPSCPVCNADGFTERIEEAICGSDFLTVMKIRNDGSLRALNNMLTKTIIEERAYFDIEIDDACTCDLLSSVEGRIIVIASNDHIGPSSGRRNERILFDEDVIVLQSNNSVKKDIVKALRKC